MIRSIPLRLQHIDLVDLAQREDWKGLRLALEAHEREQNRLLVEPLRHLVDLDEHLMEWLDIRELARQESSDVIALLEKHVTREERWLFPLVDRVRAPD